MRKTIDSLDELHLQYFEIFVLVAFEVVVLLDDVFVDNNFRIRFEFVAVQFLNLLNDAHNPRRKKRIRFEKSKQSIDLLEI